MGWIPLRVLNHLEGMERAVKPTPPPRRPPLPPGRQGAEVIGVKMTPTATNVTCAALAPAPGRMAPSLSPPSLSSSRRPPLPLVRHTLRSYHLFPHIMNKSSCFFLRSWTQWFWRAPPAIRAFPPFLRTGHSPFSSFRPPPPGGRGPPFGCSTRPPSCRGATPPTSSPRRPGPSLSPPRRWEPVCPNPQICTRPIPTFLPSRHLARDSCLAPHAAHPHLDPPPIRRAQWGNGGGARHPAPVRKVASFPQELVFVGRSTVLIRGIAAALGVPAGPFALLSVCVDGGKRGFLVLD